MLITNINNGSIEISTHFYYSPYTKYAACRFGHICPSVCTYETIVSATHPTPRDYD